jgi:hypothetical protein
LMQMEKARVNLEKEKAVQRQYAVIYEERVSKVHAMYSIILDRVKQDQQAQNEIEKLHKDEVNLAKQQENIKNQRQKKKEQISKVKRDNRRLVDEMNHAAAESTTTTTTATTTTITTAAATTTATETDERTAAAILAAVSAPLSSGTKQKKKDNSIDFTEVEEEEKKAEKTAENIEEDSERSEEEEEENEQDRNFIAAEGEVEYEEGEDELAWIEELDLNVETELKEFVEKFDAVVQENIRWKAAEVAALEILEMGQRQAVQNKIAVMRRGREKTVQEVIDGELNKTELNDMKKKLCRSYLYQWWRVNNVSELGARVR